MNAGRLALFVAVLAGVGVLLAASTETPRQPLVAPIPVLPESWEITKVYGEDRLREFFANGNIRLPQRICVPAVRVLVLEPSGKPADKASLCSFTPRTVHHHSPKPVLGISTTPAKLTSVEGTLTIPERYEPYRVIVIHSTGYAIVDHEALVRAGGRVQLTPHATIEGRFAIAGNPQPNERIGIAVSAHAWLYNPRQPAPSALRTTVVTDEVGRFRFEKMPPFEAVLYQMDEEGRPLRCCGVSCSSGGVVPAQVGAGRVVTGRVKRLAGQTITDESLWLAYDDRPPVPKAIANSGDPKLIHKWVNQWQRVQNARIARSEKFLEPRSQYEPSPIYADGSFRFEGITPGRYLLKLQAPTELSVEHDGFEVESIDGPPIDLGEVKLSDNAVPIPSAK